MADGKVVVKPNLHRGVNYNTYTLLCIEDLVKGPFCICISACLCAFYYMIYVYVACCAFMPRFSKLSNNFDMLVIIK